MISAWFQKESVGKMDESVISVDAKNSREFEIGSGRYIVCLMMSIIRSRWGSMY